MSTSLSQKLSGYSANKAVGFTQGEMQNIPFGFFDFSFFSTNINASAKLPPDESPAIIIWDALHFAKIKEQAFFACSNWLGYFDSGPRLYSTNIIATHNKQSIEVATALMAHHSILKPSTIIANLMGMNNRISNRLSQDYKVATYIPYGPYNKMIPYLSRRLYENIDSIKYIIK